MAEENSFLLPDELGWDCNDELNAYFYKWLNENKFDVDPSLDVAIAELMDNWYAIIKKYQEAE